MVKAYDMFGNEIKEIELLDDGLCRYEMVEQPTTCYGKIDSITIEYVK